MDITIPTGGGTKNRNIHDPITLDRSEQTHMRVKIDATIQQRPTQKYVSDRPREPILYPGMRTYVIICNMVAGRHTRTLRPYTNTKNQRASNFLHVTYDGQKRISL